MSTDRTVTYPAAAVREIADRLMDKDWNLPDDEALDEAREIVIDVTNAVDELRASEAKDAA